MRPSARTGLGQCLSQVCLAQSQQLAAARGLANGSELRALGRVLLWCSDTYESVASTIPRSSAVTRWARDSMDGSAGATAAAALVQVLATLQAFTFFQHAAIRAAALQVCGDPHVLPALCARQWARV